MSGLFRLFVAVLLVPALTQAAAIHVPQQLQDWEAWVLHDKEYLDCPFLFDRAASDSADFVCSWPGALQVTVDDDGGRFEQSWTVFARDEWVTLPGRIEYWPDQVTANGQAARVVLRDGRPSVMLSPGVYRLAGRFAWDQRPPALEIPRRTGLITLTVDGRAIARPQLDGSNLFLGERAQEAEARDAVSVDVYRLVADDVPLRLVTRLRLNVSGALREELFGPALPDGFVPLAIDSALPARLEPDGRLRLQVRPGQWVVSLTARAQDGADQMSLGAAEVNMPAEEIWSYQANDQLRVTSPEGLTPVDPLQVQVPGEWQSLPAFRIGAGEALTILERSRGMVSVDNDLRLQRQMWLDFDRGGFFVSDTIGGTMRTGWRLDMAVPFVLLSAKEMGEDLLVTRGEGDGESGVELRRRDVDLTTVARTGKQGGMPVTGWNARFGNVSAILHVPPGNRLVAAPGADQAPGSWLSSWQLLHFFLVLVITIASWRLFGRGAGLLALLALVLSYHETSAPHWLWLNLLVAVALLRVAPAGRLRSVVRGYEFASAILLVFALVPFLAAQLRIAIYPQLEPQAGGFVPAAVTAPLTEQDIEMKDMAAPANEAESFVRRPASTLEEVVVTAQRSASGFARYAPNAIVQAGPGKPSWAWNTYRLNWTGPVDPEQTLRLVILPRWATTALRFVEVLVLLAFAGVIASEIFGRSWSLPGGLRLGGGKSAALIAVGIVGMLLAAAPAARAQTPDPELLRELERRLTQPPECAPRCAEVLAADVNISADAVAMSLNVNTLADVAVPLPGAERGWRPTGILVNGSAASRLMLGDDRALWLQLPAGRHNVVLRGPIPAVDSLEIAFPAPPRVITTSAEGWFVGGMQDRRLVSGSLQLTRLQPEAGSEATARWESSRFPPFVRIERSLSLDLDWSVTTRVYREAPAQGALTLDVPLIDGESVLTEGIAVTEGRARVAMSPDQGVVTWQSTLSRETPLTLAAEAGSPWHEVWQIGVGSVWHATFTGVPESENPRAAPDSRNAEFFPRGGESLRIDAFRPEAAEGTTLAFDAVNLAVRYGARSAEATLALDYRSTRGAQHTIRLPADAEVTQVQIDRQVEPLRADNGELTLPILPGEHKVQIDWRSNASAGVRATTPPVDIGAAASNVSLHIELPRNRWLLATSGPRLGPAVLYWSELAVLLLFAVILGRIALAPLTSGQWLLLGLGFSTFNWLVFGVVVAWLLICGAREKWSDVSDDRYFNLLQVVVGAATVAGLLAIVSSLPVGLLGTPDMHVQGNQSYGNSLNWFADLGAGVLPTATAFTVPLLIYKILILAWALWLSFALLRWLPWVWRCFSGQGLWRNARGAAERKQQQSG